MPSPLCITEVELNAPLPFPIWVLSQAQDHSAEVSKTGEDESPYTVLSFYYIMEYIYLSIYINIIISIVNDPSEFCTAFFPKVGANPL